jgi:hypothetical protein
VGHREDACTTVEERRFQRRVRVPEEIRASAPVDGFLADANEYDHGGWKPASRSPYRGPGRAALPRLHGHFGRLPRQPASLTGRVLAGGFPDGGIVPIATLRSFNEQFNSH